MDLFVGYSQTLRTAAECHSAAEDFHPNCAAAHFHSGPWMSTLGNLLGMYGDEFPSSQWLMLGSSRPGAPRGGRLHLKNEPHVGPGPANPPTDADGPVRHNEWLGGAAPVLPQSTFNLNVLNLTL